MHAARHRRGKVQAPRALLATGLATGLAVGLLWASACNEISGASGLDFRGGGGGQGGAGNSSSTAASSSSGGVDGGASGSSSSSSGAVGAPTAQALLALTSSCKVVSKADYENDYDYSTSAASIPVCGLDGAVFWQAGMSIDCDGKSHTSPLCPSTSSETAATDSTGAALSSVDLPFVVVPALSGCTPLPFDYQSAGLQYGSVIAVIYNGTLGYGVFGDVGACQSIGQASYAMASSVGVFPGPMDGGVMPGTPTGVTYIAFVGAGGVASPIEDHAAAVTLGQKLAQSLLANN